MVKKSIHIIPSANGGGWTVKHVGSSRRALRTETKQEAIDKALVMSRESGSTFVVHGKNGQIIHVPTLSTRLPEARLRQVIRGFGTVKGAVPTSKVATAHATLLGKTSARRTGTSQTTGARKATAAATATSRTTRERKLSASKSATGRRTHTKKNSLKAK